MISALETIRRRRRREETNSPDHHGNHGNALFSLILLKLTPSFTHSLVRRSESPNHIVKLKKLDHHHHSRSMSPTPSKHTSKETKKKKANRGANDRNNVKEDLDFVRVKPKDQIPVTTFITAMEPYFAPLTEEDRSFLLEKGDSSKPYLIPPLGQYYADAWHEEDQAIGHDTKASPISSRQGSIDPNVRQQPLKFISGKDIADDSFLLQDDVTCGSLTERLLSSLVMEDIIDPVKKEQDVIMEEPQSPEGQTIAEMASDPSDEIVNFEERLKRELQYAGLFGEDDVS